MPLSASICSPPPPLPFPFDQQTHPVTILVMHWCDVSHGCVFPGLALYIHNLSSSSCFLPHTMLPLLLSSCYLHTRGHLLSENMCLRSTANTQTFPEACLTWCLIGHTISKGCSAYTGRLSCELKWHDSGSAEVIKHVRLTSFSGASWHSSALFSLNLQRKMSITISTRKNKRVMKKKVHGKKLMPPRNLTPAVILVCRWDFVGIDWRWGSPRFKAPQRNK